MLIVLTVIMAASAMEVAGGVDYLVRVAERIIRRNPKHVTLVAPLVTYGFTFASGTGHIVYPLLPVIYEVAHENGIRPERPMAIATIASQQAITASPISAATAAMIGLLAGHGISLLHLLLICLPATLLAVLGAALVQMRIGPELADDPEYQRRRQAGEVPAPRSRAPGEEESPPPLRRGSRLSAVIFFAGVLLVVLAGMFPALRTLPARSGIGVPHVVAMPMAIAIVMLAVAAIILVATKSSPSEVTKCKTCQSGLTAVIGILGLAWLGDTFISAHQDVHPRRPRPDGPKPPRGPSPSASSRPRCSFTARPPPPAR
jgi:anaerobic C4-dicarboxylate transporter DcuA